MPIVLFAGFLFSAPNAAYRRRGVKALCCLVAPLAASDVQRSGPMGVVPPCFLVGEAGVSKGFLGMSVHFPSAIFNLCCQLKSSCLIFICSFGSRSKKWLGSKTASPFVSVASCVLFSLPLSRLFKKARFPFFDKGSWLISRDTKIRLPQLETNPRESWNSDTSRRAPISR